MGRRRSPWWPSSSRSCPGCCPTGRRPSADGAWRWRWAAMPWWAAPSSAGQRRGRRSTMPGRVVAGLLGGRQSWCNHCGGRRNAGICADVLLVSRAMPVVGELWIRDAINSLWRPCVRLLAAAARGPARGGLRDSVLDDDHLIACGGAEPRADTCQRLDGHDAGDHGMTTGTVGTNGQGTPSELERLEASYRIIQQRDGTAERRAFQWKLLACALVGITLGVGVWDHLDRRTSLQGFVQVVQVNDHGEVVKVGVPHDLMMYEPSDAQYLDMLAEWVRKV